MHDLDQALTELDDEMEFEDEFEDEFEQTRMDMNSKERNSARLLSGGSACCLFHGRQAAVAVGLKKILKS